MNLSGIHPSWSSFFTADIAKLVNEIMRDVLADGDVTPNQATMLRFLTIDLFASKVVILGQDPYPQEGVATGRAFEVGSLGSWQQSFRNTSLRNIVRALYASRYNRILTFKEVRSLIGPDFPLLPPSKLFEFWENQGVLLLNTSFSCKVNKPGSHSAIWQPFTHALLNYINQQMPELTWLLWGNHARLAVGHLSIKNGICSTHPMICHERPDDFLYGDINHFKATSHLIDWVGQDTATYTGRLF
ncbi:uracil-DNA glycosylase [Alkaliflexus imshenetskii]|uniref:uracil-DNA glycosylase n=1 Tax=Alkaliflexus imshenetskii TaxID=286730 RepID=UPI0004AD9859|nr:uracil-DNA glycosylase [Alkaliflexus imshenetskii]